MEERFRKKEKFNVQPQTGLLTGVLDMNPRGFGFVRISEDEEDIYIHRENLSSAMHRDEVQVSLIPNSRREGRITKVLKRVNTEVAGTLEKTKKIFYVIPDNPRLIEDIIIAQTSLHGAYPQDKVVAKILEWPSKHLNPQGEIIEILGKANDPKLDSLVIAKTYHLPLRFPEKVEKELQSLDTCISVHERNLRWDLRDLWTFTIDPEDARDFDDALSIEKIDYGWRLGIHIADVSFYVPAGSGIDQEAFQRGCTVYFPDRAIRMLPERLSRQICSLDEGKECFAKSIIAQINEQGELLDWKLGKSIIRSRKRFSYDEVTRLLSNSTNSHSEDPLMGSLSHLNKLTQILFKNRLKHGALELNIPELELEQDGQGRVVAFHVHKKESSHRLVEECMLLANHLVAYLLVEKNLPGIYRVHEKPSKVDQEELKQFLKRLGIHHKSQLDSLGLAGLAEDVQSKPIAPLIHMHILRSLKEARYSPKNLGHFALALDYYLHFTSPIRRYPDLFVHQILDQLYFRTHPKTEIEDLLAIALSSSENERTADRVEREYIDFKRLRFFKEKLENGTLKPLRVIITDVKEFGIWVQEEHTMAEGLIHVSSLKDDFYLFDPERLCLQGRQTKRKFKLGDLLKVRVENVDLYKKQIDFKLVSARPL